MKLKSKYKPKKIISETEDPLQFIYESMTRDRFMQDILGTNPEPEQDNRRMCKIIVHSGKFHQDELFAIALVKTFLPKFRWDYARVFEREDLETELSSGHEMYIVADIGRHAGWSMYNGTPVLWLDHHQDNAIQPQVQLVYDAVREFFEMSDMEKRVMERVCKDILTLINREDRGRQMVREPGDIPLTKYIAGQNQININSPEQDQRFKQKLEEMVDYLRNMMKQAERNIRDEDEANKLLQETPEGSPLVSPKKYNAQLAGIAQKNNIPLVVYPDTARGGFILMTIKPVNKEFMISIPEDAKQHGQTFRYPSGWLQQFPTIDMQIEYGRKLIQNQKQPYKEDESDDWKDMEQDVRMEMIRSDLPPETNPVTGFKPKQKKN